MVVLDIKRRKLEPDILVIELEGKLVTGNDSRRLEWGIEDLAQQEEKKVIIDLSRVTYMDSGGLGVLLTCHGKINEAGGQLNVAGAQGVVSKVLQMTRTNTIVGSYATVEEAAAGFAAS